MWFLPLQHTAEIIPVQLHTLFIPIYTTNSVRIQNLYLSERCNYINENDFQQNVCDNMTTQRSGAAKVIELPSQTDVCCDWNCGPGCTEAPIRDARSQRHEKTRIWLRRSGPGNVTRLEFLVYHPRARTIARGEVIVFPLRLAPQKQKELCLAGYILTWDGNWSHYVHIKGTVIKKKNYGIRPNIRRLRAWGDSFFPTRM